MSARSRLQARCSPRGLDARGPEVGGAEARVEIAQRPGADDADPAQPGRLACGHRRGDERRRPQRAERRRVEPVAIEPAAFVAVAGRTARSRTVSVNQRNACSTPSTPTGRRDDPVVPRSADRARPSARRRGPARSRGRRSSPGARWVEPTPLASTQTRAPSCARRVAAVSPDVPAPITTASNPSSALMTAGAPRREHPGRSSRRSAPGAAGRRREPARPLSSAPAGTRAAPCPPRLR